MQPARVGVTGCSKKEQVSDASCLETIESKAETIGAISGPAGCVPSSGLRVRAREGLAAENHANMARILAEHGAPAYRRRPGRKRSWLHTRPMHRLP